MEPRKAGSPADAEVNATATGAEGAVTQKSGQIRTLSEWETVLVGGGETTPLWP